MWVRNSERGETNGRPTLGVEDGGLHSAEALLLARYFMFMQVYLHPVRRIYDLHLKEYLQSWLHTGMYSTDLRRHLATTDDEVLVALRQSAGQEEQHRDGAARRIMERGHYHLLYERTLADRKINVEAAKAVYEAARAEFGPDSVRYDSVPEKGATIDFPVLMHNGTIISALDRSTTLAAIPPAATHRVFVSPELREQAENWLRKGRQRIIAG